MLFVVKDGATAITLWPLFSAKFHRRRVAEGNATASIASINQAAKRVGASAARSYGNDASTPGLKSYALKPTRESARDRETPSGGSAGSRRVIHSASNRTSTLSSDAGRLSASQRRPP